MASLALWTLISTHLYVVSGYPYFQTYIPNGPNVPNPCLPDAAWPGVGHKNPAGAGERNPFGLDFARSGYNWKTVCNLDSDGDGWTNGEELGDPDCTWTQSDPTPAAVNITHPGVCEPLSSATCIHMNSWLTCPSQFNCPAIDEPDVLSLPLRIPPTPVLPKETTYTCYGFSLPNDTDYHVIATTPIINTTNTKSLVHHIIIYMCNDWQADDTLFTKPTECFMGNPSCFSMVGLWGVGTTGQCHSDAYGFPMGKHGFKFAIVEIHWNNPTLADNYVDSSGMMVYYTPKLRPNSGQTVITGQLALEIPPKVSSITYQSQCGEYCTSPLTHPLKIPWITLHMHGLGKSGRVELYRNGTLAAVLLESRNYDYDNPPEVMFDKPHVFHPGDELRVICEFSSLTRNVTTRWGEGTNEEMCFAFLTYYPADPTFMSCYQHNTLEVCSSVSFKCDFDSYVTLADTVASVCTTSSDCSPTCHALMEDIRKTECLDGDLGLFFYDFVPNAKRIFVLIEQCGLDQNAAGDAAQLLSSFWIVTTALLLLLTSFITSPLL